MSVHVTAACKKIDVTGAKRAVLLEFADHANDDGICWPSRTRIMYNTGLSESAVKQQMRALREDGILAVVDHYEGGRGRVPIYKVCPEKGAQKIPFGEFCENLKGANGDPERGHILPERGHEVPPEPSENRKQEPSPKNASVADAPDAAGEPPPSGNVPTEGKVEGWHFEEYLREELAGSDVPLTRGKARRYTGDANKLLKEGVEPEELYEACDRVVSEWGRVRLSLDDALRDLRTGRRSNGGGKGESRLPEHERWKERAAGAPELYAAPREPEETEEEKAAREKLREDRRAEFRRMKAEAEAKKSA